MAIVTSPIPVLTGLGHEIDRSVADEVAHTALKTPTACAGALIDAVHEYQSATERAWGAIAALARQDLERVAGALSEPVMAEGGDTVWLDEETLLVGIGYRTNPAAAAALEEAFPGVEVLLFDLPHWNGRAEVMHLMSFISPLDRDLALVYTRIAPVRLLAMLAERGIEVVEVPDEEFESQGPNVLALGPRRALALDGNPETRRRMERAGVDVVIYTGDEISRKGDGGPTCLTRPLLRS